MSAQYVFDYPNYFIDSQGLYARIVPWLNRRYNITGLLYWYTVYAWNQDGKDPWEDQYEEQFYCNGDGTLFYPGTPSKIGGTTDIPVSSIRLNLIREGMEDYEYFHLIDQIGDGSWLDAVLEETTPHTYHWEHDSAELYALRDEMAQRIIDAQQ